MSSPAAIAALTTPAASLPLQAGLLVLTTTRTAGLVLAAPLLWTEAPARVRAALVLALGVVSYGTAQAALPVVPSAERIAWAAPTEFALGLAMGFVVRLAVSTVEIVGDVASPMLGFGAATLFDPLQQVSETGLTKLLRLLALTLALLLGIHRLVLGALLVSFRIIPVASMIDVSFCVPELARLSGDALAVGMRLALPVVGALLITQVGLAFISRASPAMQIFSIGFAVSLVTGALVLVITLPETAREIEGELAQVGGRIEAVLLAAEAHHE